MNRIVAWFATNHVAANLLMGFAILAGLASLTQIPVKISVEVAETSLSRNNLTFDDIAKAFGRHSRRCHEDGRGRDTAPH